MENMKNPNLHLTMRKTTGKSEKFRDDVKRKYLPIIGTMLILIPSLFLVFGGIKGVKKVHLSQDVLRYQPSIEKYAQEYGVSDYVEYLLAIMQVESGGKGNDIMQCSESLGLSPNSLGAEESIQQACKYFSELINTAESIGCDMESVIQAYNYGLGYLFYVAENGHVHTYELAEEFAKIYSEGNKAAYPNPVAEQQNGGWRYQYGNMFYVVLVNQYLESGSNWK